MTVAAFVACTMLLLQPTLLPWLLQLQLQLQLVLLLLLLLRVTHDGRKPDGHNTRADNITPLLLSAVCF